MNKKELIARVTEKAGVSTKADFEQTEEIISVLWETIMEEVACGNKVQILGFGTFEQRIRKEKTMRNPKNIEELITVPEAKIPVFKAGKNFKDMVNP